MADLIRAELEALIAAYDEHGGRWPEEDERALAGAVERARAALDAQPPAPGADTQQLQQIAHAASDYLCGKRFPAFAEEHGGLHILEAQLLRLLAHHEHGPRPVPGVDVPGPDGDYGGLQELCASEGVDPRVGVPLLKRARQAWRQTDRLHVLQQENHRFREPERTILCDILASGGLLPDPEGKRYGMPAPTLAPALDADTLRKVWREAAWGGRWATLVDYIALAVEAQRAPSGNPPASDEYLAVELILPASEGELGDLAGCVEAWAARLDEGTPEERLLGRVAYVLRQRQALPHDGEVDALIKILSRIARMLDFMPDNPPNGLVIHRAIELLRQPAPAPAAVPVAVAERPWEREGWCDAEGRCWMGDPGGGGFIPSWRFCRPEDAPNMTVSLPHCAIPIPQPPLGGEVGE